ncbi:MAG: hypothetical protein GEU28_13670 [Dehalococcoidia bacterium]|nr:hypothetical protein [Dehalococcoidia bacterium]
MQLFLVRHGESDIPTGHIQKNFPLSDLGRRQAARLGERFGGMAIDQLVTSPFKRCLETAQSIADAAGVARSEVPGLGAVDAGSLHDLPITRIRELYPEMAKMPGTFDYSPAGGETPRAFAERITTAFVEAIWDRYREQDLTVVCVSHEETVNAILCHALGVDYTGFHAFKIDHTSVSKLDVRFGRARILYTNDTSHLGDLPLGASGKGRPASD